LPLPPLGKPERLLVRYDRLTAGRLAWLRVTMTDLPASATLAAHLSGLAPKPTWRHEAEVGKLEVSGWPALRIAFVGRWDNQDYVSETVAVRKGDRVYLLTASFPAEDAEAREQVRVAVAGAVWR
jgi:hypothetical protein